MGAFFGTFFSETIFLQDHTLQYVVLFVMIYSNIFMNVPNRKNIAKMCDFMKKRHPKRLPSKNTRLFDGCLFWNLFGCLFLYHQIFLNPRPYFLIYWDHEMFQRS